MTPTYARAKNKPHLWFGFAVPILALAFALPAVVGISLNGVLGVLSFLAILAVTLPVANLLSRKEPNWLLFRWRGWWMKPIYDSGKWKPFRLQIK